MTAAHFTIKQTPLNTFYKGMLFAGKGSLLLDYSHICQLALDMGFFNALQRSLMIRLLADSWAVPGGCERALDTLCGYLTVYAAPGYEFTAWIIQGRKVWGWFPREG